LRTKNPALSPFIEQVVMKTLARKIPARFTNIQAFADALAWAVGQETSQQNTTEQKPRRQFLSPMPFINQDS